MGPADAAAECAACGAACPPDARFCPSCGQPRSPEPSFEERRHVTVVFADIVGSTSSAEDLDVEDVRVRLLRFHGAVSEALERHGGVVEKYIGDAVVALYGAERTHEDDSVRAVRAALAVRDAVVRLQSAEPWLDLHVRIGVNAGEALVDVGAARHGPEGVVAGDVMNTAARIQAAAPVDGVLVGASAYRASRHSIRYRRSEPVAGKGKTAAIEVWSATSERERPLSRGTRARFVGRRRELAQLERVWEEAVETRTARLTTVVGPAGAGKSRLVEEGLAGVDATVLRGRCLAYGEGITYWPIAEALAGAAGTRLSTSPDELGGRLTKLIDTVGAGASLEERLTVRRALASLIGLGAEARASGSITQAELHWGVGRLLEWSAAGRPLVLLVEDVHWAEPTLLELLASLEGVRAPLLVLATARPPDDPRSPPGPGVELPLAPLTPGDSLDLVGELLGVAAHPDVRASLVERAAGNPLYLEETIRALAAGGLLDSGADVWDLPVPDAVRALVGARLDRLEGSDRRLLGAAAVVGTVFWEGALGRLSADAASVDVEPLLEEEFVHARPFSSIEGEREYAFHHDLIRDVAYDRLPKAVRAELHAACADWVEGLAGAAELVEIVASHLERSCLLLRGTKRPAMSPPVERAVDALELAARRAERREGFSEAERYLGRALELLADADPARDVLTVRRCGHEVALGRLDEALGELNRLIADDAVARRSPAARGRALVWSANVHAKQGRPAEARPCLDEAARVAETIGDAEIGARAAYELAALFATFDGDIEGAIEELERGRKLAAACDEPGLALEGRLRHGFHLVELGRMEDAKRELHAVVDTAEELGRPRDAARARMELAFVHYLFEGADAEAEILARGAQDVFVRVGDTYFVTQNLQLLSKLALRRGDADDAAALARESVAAARPIGGWAVVEAEAALVEALLSLGRVEEARGAAAAARVDLPPDDADALRAVVRSEAAVAAALGDTHAARAAFEQAIALADGRGQPLDRAVERLAFARSIPPAGDPAAAEALAQARAICAQIGADGLVGQAEPVRSTA